MHVNGFTVIIGSFYWGRSNHLKEHLLIQRHQISNFQNSQKILEWEKPSILVFLPNILVFQCPFQVCFPINHKFCFCNPPMTHFHAPLFLQILGYFAWSNTPSPPIFHHLQLGRKLLLTNF